LHEAFSVWAPVLASGVDEPLTFDRYMMLTRYVLAAIELPLPLDVIERALAEVAALVEASPGFAVCRSRLLLARSRLALGRGRAQDALDHGLEGLVRRKVETPVYTYSTHYRTIARAALLAGQPDLAADLVVEWDRIEHAYLDSKRNALAAARANLARYRGDPEEAIRLVEPVARAAIHTDDAVYGADASFAHVRACLAAGVPERARASLAHVLRLRNSTIGELRFESRLLLADYSLAHVLRAEGRAEDPEFESAPLRATPPATLTARGVAHHALRAARRCAAAAREGSRLDRWLGSSHRETIVARRRARLARTEAAAECVTPAPPA
jgi:hypothetical protein